MTIPTRTAPIEIEALRGQLRTRDAENAKLRQENADLRHNVEVYRKLAFVSMATGKGTFADI